MNEPGQQGFTLFELLVAFVILAVFLGALLENLSQAARFESRAVATVQRSLEIRSIMDMAAVDPLAGQTSGHLTDGTFWSLKITAPDNTGADLRDLPLALMYLELTITPTDGPEVGYATLALMPTAQAAQ